MKEALLQVGRHVDLEVNTEKTKCMIVSHHQNAGQNHNLLIANKYIKQVAKFKYFGIAVTNQNCIYEGIKRRLILMNACYHSVQWILPSPLVCKNLKTNVKKV
jgi:hypothetical protein